MDENHEIKRCDNLPYCNPHWYCIHCHSHWSFSGYTKEELEQMKCPERTARIIAKRKKEERKKVISAVENCIATPKCRDCPWEECEERHETVELPLGLVKKALEFLKAQELREV